MSISTARLWELLAESELLSPDEIARLKHEFATPAHEAANAQQLASWLVAGKKISQYQAQILLAGHAGPFRYGDYRIYDRIESGRMAGMFRAVHIVSRHRVCLFFLSGTSVQEPATIARLAYHASQANRASVGHPHLMRCYHLADEGTFKFIALEDIQGRRVERRLATHGAMQPAEACRIARHAALGLARLHAMNQVHGEVRPANLWIEPSGNTKLLMFPLARDPLAPPPRYAEATVSGGRLPPEADYLAPELAGGAAPDARADIYALGCTLYHMLANQPPFAGSDLKHKLALHATAKPLPLEQLNPAVTPALAKLVNYMMAKDPDLRYQEANSIVEALLPHLAAGDAQTRLSPPSKSAAAYDAWLRTLKEPTPPLVETPVPARVAPAAPAAAMPVAPAPVMTTAATPVQAAPLRAVPVQAVSVQPGFAQPFAAPTYGQPMPPPGATLASEAAIAVRTKRSARQSRRTLLLVSIGVALLGALALSLWVKTSGILTASTDHDTPLEPAADAGTHMPPPEPADNVEAVPAAPATTRPSGPQDAIAAIAEPVWQSPTSGQPLKLTYLAPGAQMIVAVRPYDLVTQTEGARLLDERVTGVLAPWLLKQVPAMVGTPLENIEQLLVGVLDRGTQMPEVALVAHTRESLDRDAAVAAWGNPAVVEAAGQKYYQSDTLGYYLPTGGEGKIVVVAPQAEMADIVANGETGAFLLPPMESLLRVSDDQRLLTVLVTPRFLAGGGRAMFTGVGKRLADAIDWLLAGDNPASTPEAALLSVHLGDLSFAELRLYDPASSPAATTDAAALHDRLRQFPKKLDVYIRGLISTPYSFEVLSNSYDMLRTAVENMRFGAADKQIVARLYLPVNAAHNLALVAHLAMLENPGVLGAARAPTAAAGPAQPQTVAEKLKKKINLAFPRNTLEVSMQLLSDELNIPITILGGDLQLEGITKNQSFGLDERDKPADEILQKIMKQANPDGKLVYVIKPGKSGGDELFITTRAAVAKRGDKLPPELELSK